MGGNAGTQPGVLTRRAGCVRAGTLVVYLGDWVLQDSFVAATCLVRNGLMLAERGLW